MATMVGKPVFLDTNVLIYAGRPESVQHDAALAALKRLEMEGCSFWISSQVLREYLAVVTRPQSMIPALPMAEAIADVRRFMDLFDIAEDRPTILDRLLRIVTAYPTAGKQIHDAHLVATMVDYGINRLLTFNRRDFERFASFIRLEATNH
jgi:toxin-antitoxin system PIN domain toxin